MYFYRGLHIRSQREDFRQGAHKAQHAIMNIIGNRIIESNALSFAEFEKYCKRLSYIIIKLFVYIYRTDGR